MYVVVPRRETTSCIPKDHPAFPTAMHMLRELTEIFQQEHNLSPLVKGVCWKIAEQHVTNMMATETEEFTTMEGSTQTDAPHPHHPHHPACMQRQRHKHKRHHHHHHQHTPPQTTQLRQTHPPPLHGVTQRQQPPLPPNYHLHPRGGRTRGSDPPLVQTRPDNDHHHHHHNPPRVGTAIRLPARMPPR